MVEILKEYSILHLKSSTVIMMLNICIEFPDMYSINKFIGIDFAPIMATSIAFLTFNLEIISLSILDFFGIVVGWDEKPFGDNSSAFLDLDLSIFVTSIFHFDNGICCLDCEKCPTESVQRPRNLKYQIK